jgi:hypothetical protein
MPAILYCYSNMGRHYIHEYLTPSDEYNAYPYLNNNKVTLINTAYLSLTVSMFISLYLRSDWLRSTGNSVVNHLKLFICNKIYIEPCQ